MPVLRTHPDSAEVLFEYGLTLSALQRGAEAVAALEKVVAVMPDHPEAWRLLADHAAAVGDTDKSEAAHLKHLRCASQNPDLQKAAAAMIGNELSVAERLLKAYLKAAPTDVTAVRMLAEVAVRVGRNDEAQALLEYCLELAPGFSGARYNWQSCCTGPINPTGLSPRWNNCLPRTRSGGISQSGSRCLQRIG